MKILTVEKDKIYYLLGEKLVLLRTNELTIDNGDYEIQICCNKINISRHLGSGMNLLFYYSDKTFILSDSYNDFSDTLRFTINKQAYEATSLYGFCPPPETLINHISKVPLFAQIQLTINTNRITLSVDYQFSSINNIDINVESLYEVIKDEKKCDVSILFSGGLDSSILYKLYEQSIKKSISSGYEFEDIDLIEKKYSLSAANLLQFSTNYYSFQLSELLKLLPEIIKITEEPLSHIQSLLIYRLLKGDIFDHNSLILNGQGADALFGRFSIAYNSFCVPSLSKDLLVVSQINSRNLDNNAKNFYLNIIGDVDNTIHCWQKCASHFHYKMFFPFFSDKIFNLIRSKKKQRKINICSHYDKRVLKELAEQIGIHESIIDREKASFGPRSKMWGQTIAKHLSIDYLPSERYKLWNLLNLKIWEDTIINRLTPNDIIKKYNLLSND